MESWTCMTADLLILILTTICVEFQKIKKVELCSRV